MHPFRWIPADGERHASRDKKPHGWPDGTVVNALCGRSVRADNRDVAWLWETCPACNQAAHNMLDIAWRPTVLDEAI